MLFQKNLFSESRSSFYAAVKTRCKGETFYTGEFQSACNVHGCQG